MRRSRNTARLMAGAATGVGLAMAGGAMAQQEVAKLSPADLSGGDEFGGAVSIDGDLAVVGAGGKDAGNGFFSGAAYVFREVDGAWQQVTQLTAADGGAVDLFGLSVAVGGGTVMIGSNNPEMGSNSGSVYVFREQGGSWQQVAKLVGEDTVAGDRFGSSIAMDGDLAVIGARSHGVGGAAYVFRETGGVWQQVTKLTHQFSFSGDQFGASVAIDDGVVVVGAANNGVQGDDTGAAYVFREVGGVWQEVGHLLATDPNIGDRMGGSVSISGDTVLVGAEFQTDAAGAVYVFSDTNGTWSQTAKLAADVPTPFSLFGRRVAIDGDNALIAASSLDGGTVFHFVRENGVWEIESSFRNSDAGAGDRFGLGMSLDGTTALVGAPLHNEPANNAGAAYVIDLEGGAGPACPPDLNGDGVVDADDFFLFLQLFADGDPLADFNGDGVIDADDFFAFLSAFAAGC